MYQILLSASRRLENSERIREPDSLEISCFSDSYAAFKALKSIVN